MAVYGHSKHHPTVVEQRTFSLVTSSGISDLRGFLTAVERRGDGSAAEISRSQNPFLWNVYRGKSVYTYPPTAVVVVTLPYERPYLTAIDWAEFSNVTQTGISGRKHLLMAVERRRDGSIAEVSQSQRSFLWSDSEGGVFVHEPTTFVVVKRPVK